MGRRDRERRQSTARRRAQQKQTGFTTTKFRLPEGLGFWDFKEDVTKIDIVPYIVGKGNPFAKPGELHYERTYYQYRAKIGAEQKFYITLAETYGLKDPVQEHRQQIQRKVPANAVEEKELKDLAYSLGPSERQLFLIYDHSQKDKGVQLFDFSHHKFGKLLDSRIDKSDEEEGWDGFYFPDEDGFSLKVTWENDPTYGLGAVAIDFVPRREPLPEAIAEHGYCLDDYLVQMPYEKLKAIFEHREYKELEEDNDVDMAKEIAEEEEKQRPKKASGSSMSTNHTSTQSQEKKSRFREGVDKPKSNGSTYKKGDEVEYEGQKCTVMKVSPDGTSHTLMDENEDIIKAVAVDELKPWKDKPKSKPKPKPEPEDDDDAPFEDEKQKATAKAAVEDDDDDDVWDDDF